MWYNFTWDATFDQKDDVPLAKGKRQPKAKSTGSTDGVEVVSVTMPNMKQLSFLDSLERFQVQTTTGADTTATAHQAGDASGHLQTEMFRISYCTYVRICFICLLLVCFLLNLHIEGNIASICHTMQGGLFC